MTRAQVYLPDTLYAEAKRISREQELTLSEIVRRGLEVMAQLYPRDRQSGASQLPKPVKMGKLLAPVEQWRELANEERPLAPE